MRSSLYRPLSAQQISSAVCNSLHSQHAFHPIPLKEHLDRLDNSNHVPNCVTFAYLLRWCGHAKALVDAHRLHDRIIKCGFEQKKLVANLLVQMYGNCGALPDAYVLFVSLYKADQFSWNFMMTAFARHGCFKQALELFDQMQQEGVKPDKYIFASIISACVEKSAFAEGKHMHSLIIEHGFQLDNVLGNAIVNMYGKCGSLHDAKTMFDQMDNQTEASWNAIISGYVYHGQGQDAIGLFGRMQNEGIIPNKVTFISIISACASWECLAEGKRMHACLVVAGYEVHLVVGNTLVNMYGKCGSLKEARELFHNLPQHSTVSWNAMITSYSQHGEGRHAFELFDQMQHEGVSPNKITFVSVLSAFGSHTALREGKRLHARFMGSCLELDMVLQSCLIHMYGKCGSIDGARKMFDLMTERDVYAWNALIAGCSQQNQGKAALHLFHQMQQEGMLPDKVTFASILSGCVSQAALREGKQMHALIAGSRVESDVVMGSALVNMYGKCGSLSDAQLMFDGMPERNGYSWTAMIDAYAQHGLGKDAMLVFEQMQWEGIRPNKVTFLCMLSACANEAALTDGKHIHASIMGSGFERDIVVANALLTMYSKCGSLEDARWVFDTIPEWNMVSWTAMIAAYAQHGQGKEALLHFEQMQQKHLGADNVTYVEVLSACSHAGLVDEGCRVFLSMKYHGMAPAVDHYNCMVDLLTRAGCLDEAEELIYNMPLKPTIVSWLTLLGACRNQLDLKRGERVAKRVFDFHLEDPAPFVALSNLYMAAGRVTDAAYTINEAWVKGEEKHLCSNSTDSKLWLHEYSFASNQVHQLKEELMLVGNV